jgi:hypothetical protein
MYEKDLRGLKDGEGAPAFLMCIMGLEVNPATYARSSLLDTFLAITFMTSALTLVASLTLFEMNSVSNLRLSSLFFFFSALLGFPNHESIFSLFQSDFHHGDRLT